MCMDQSKINTLDLGYTYQDRVFFVHCIRGK
jgi:hypothetical protein